MLGAVLGIALALGGIRVLKRLAETQSRIDLTAGLVFPRLDDIDLNPRSWASRLPRAWSPRSSVAWLPRGGTRVRIR